MNETAAIQKFKKDHPEGVYYKLHGGRFQSTLPDILWIKNGLVQFLEFKVVDGDFLPWAKCRLGQYLTMIKMRDNNAEVWYVVWSKKRKQFYKFPPEIVVEGKSTPLDESMVYLLS